MENTFSTSSGCFSFSKPLSHCALTEMFYVYLMLTFYVNIFYVNFCAVSTPVVCISFLPVLMWWVMNVRKNTVSICNKGEERLIKYTVPDSFKAGFLGQVLVGPDFSLLFISSLGFSSLKKCFPAQSHPPSVGFIFFFKNKTQKAVLHYFLFLKPKGFQEKEWWQKCISLKNKHFK